MKIGILGWGSLIWDPRPEFDARVSAWCADGPRLPIEFCRVSKSRHGALTLVIDEDLGTGVDTLYAISTRSTVDDAVADLRDREATVTKCIAVVTTDGRLNRGRCSGTVLDWAALHKLDAVVWTDLQSNFSDRTKQVFSHEAGLSHLRSLSALGVQQAVTYVQRAPAQVKTPFRQFLDDNAWFREQATLLNQPVG